MFAQLKVLAVSATLASAWIPASAAERPPEGYWLVKDHGFTVRIASCGGSLCGELVGLNQSPRPDRLRLDAKNPDASKRVRPLCGLQLFGSFTPSAREEAKWEGGWIYNPQDGRTYTSELRRIDADTITVRGFVLGGLLGRNLTLVRQPRPGDLCEKPERLAVRDNVGADPVAE